MRYYDAAVGMLYIIDVFGMELVCDLSCNRISDSCDMVPGEMANVLMSLRIRAVMFTVVFIAERSPRRMSAWRLIYFIAHFGSGGGGGMITSSSPGNHVSG